VARPEHLSYSQLNKYNGCPLAYKYAYIDHLKSGGENRHLRVGITVHKAIAGYTEYLLKNGLESEPSWLGGYEPELPMDESEEVRKIVEKFVDSHTFTRSRYTQPGDCRIEYKVSIKLGGHPFMAVFDRIDNLGSVVVITDYKTDHRIRPQEDVNNDLQLQIYALTASEIYPDAEKFVCQLDFVRHNVTKEVVFTVDDIEKIKVNLMKNICRLEKDEKDNKFQATPGSQCVWCGYTHLCPAVKSKTIETIVVENDAVEAAKQFVVLQARLGVLKSLLKDWCTRQGPVDIGDSDVGFKKISQFKYSDVKQMAKIFKEAGYEPMDYMSVDTKKVNNLKKSLNHDPLKDTLNDLAEDKSYSKLEILKKQGQPQKGV
jgi:putative RecB family exonuclease